MPTKRQQKQKQKTKPKRKRLTKAQRVQAQRLKDFQRGITFGYISNGLCELVTAEYERSPWLQKMGITKQELANEAIDTLCEELDVPPMSKVEIKAYDDQMRHIIAVVSEIIRTSEGLNSVINKMAKTLSYKERVNLQ